MKSSNAAGVRFVVFLFVVILCAGGALLWWFDATSAPDTADTATVEFTISSGNGVRTIAANLAGEKLIRSPTAFFMLVKLMGIERNLQAGQFRLARNMDARTVARALMHGYDDLEIQTLEGWRNQEIATLLTQKLGIPEDEFLRNAKEGYMFPEKYQIPRDASAGAIIDILSREFNRKVTEKMRTDIKNSGRTLDEVIILASIVEREAKGDDRPIIAGILMNRLKADWPLQVDATVQYALNTYQYRERTWWKKELTEADLKIKSPYNTYLHPGLPPGPISNPGIESIRAVVYPTKTEYMFYLHDPSGAVHYAKTVEEHNANVEKYLR